VNRLGPEDYQSNRYIRKILRLAQASRKDVFYDLGCGRGQLCIIAVKEFGVKRAVGIEMHRGRAAKARRAVATVGFSDRIEIRDEDFMDSDLHDATIAYCGLTEEEDDVEHFGSILQPGARFVTLFLPFVGVLPAAADYPFYRMDLPFKMTSDATSWASSILFRKANIEDLYEELDTDREYRYDKRVFSRLVGKRLRDR
jgi:SAM-dependent methyltransferase